MHLHDWLTHKSSPRQIRVWLGVSLAISLLYSLLALQQAFGSEYVIQDDARQHVFWMRRFLDPELFPNDEIADYFQSVAPVGYSTLYRLFAAIAIDPVVLSKLLPPVLGLIATGYGFRIGIHLLPLPVAGFTVALLLNQSLWMRDDIVSGTPVAFAGPLLLAFLYYLLRRSLLPCLVVIALQGVFYPQTVFVSAAILLLRMVKRRQNGVGIGIDRSHCRVSLVSLGVAVLVMLPYALKPSTYGSIITAAQAKSLPIFADGGWGAFFSDHVAEFWLCGKRSGMIPTEWCEILTTPAAPLDVLRIPQFWFTLVFLVLWLWRSRFPLIQQIHADGWLLPQVVVASLGLFFVAHAVAFKLHLPNRYTEHTFRIIAAVAAGLALVILWDTVTRVWLRQGRSRLATGSTLLLGLLLLLYPTNLRIDDAVFPVTGYGVGRTPALYEFLAQQPKDSLIASLSSETNKLPSFAKRSVLVGHEGYTLPYHQGYFRDMRQRTTDLMLAQYSPDPTVVKNLIRQYGIDIWLIEQTSFKPNYLDETEVFAQFPDVTQVVRSQLKLNRPPALFRMARTCTTFKVDQFRVLDAQCLLQWE